jgi:phage terminase small subunit
MKTPNRPLSPRQLAFVERLTVTPEMRPYEAARLAGYSAMSASTMPARLFKDARIVAAFDAAGIDVLAPEPIGEPS